MNAMLVLLISIVVLAVGYVFYGGWLAKQWGVKPDRPTAANIVTSIVIIVAVVAIGFNFPVLALDNTTWMVVVGLYILAASVAPVWILLQPRDYLSSYLLYGMIAVVLAVKGVRTIVRTRRTEA